MINLDMKSYALVLSVGLLCSQVGAQAEEFSIARVWDEEILSAIRIDLPNPPVHARNLYTLSAAMYDAWAAYDPIAVGFIHHDKHSAADVEAARREAISFAAYRILKERYALSKAAATTLPVLDARLAALGFNKNNESLDPSTPAGLGNLIAAEISAYLISDGALQLRGYADYPAALGGYASLNRPLVTGDREPIVADINHWQPLIITNQVSQNGIPLEAVQKFVGAQWLGVRPFALVRTDSSKPWIDPGPPDQLDGVGNARFRSEVVDVIRASSYLTPDDGVTMDISPGAWGNNSLGANDGHGYPVNPVTGQPYAPNVVKRGDFARVLAEFWADGPTSETPPGHWNTLANYVSYHPQFQRRLGGVGPVLGALEWDVKLYFTLNGALHDAACAAWSLKRYYDGWRPLSAVRYMSYKGQSSDITQLRYHPQGFGLIPGLIEQVTEETTGTGQRHFGLPVGHIAINAWPGQPADSTNSYSGVRWLLALDWLPYQRKNFVTPAFPGYISGHSTFSRSAAEVLTAITGSPYFPGGLGTFNAPKDNFLAFEKGPTAAVQLQWGTYFDAADQAGISRIYGGIHVSNDDLTGRRTGALCGKGAWNLAKQYFDGSILNQPIALSMTPVNNSQCEIRFNTQRGFHYKLVASPDLDGEFEEVPFSTFQAVDSSYSRLDVFLGIQRFFKAMRVE